MTWTLPVQSITADALEGIGHVLAPQGEPRVINGGASRKWDRLLPPEAFDRRMNLGLILTSPWGPRLSYVERHCHTHQFFMPTEQGRYCFVIGGNSENGPVRDDLRALICEAGEGVSFSPGTWHSPLMPLDGAVMFLTAMRQSDVPDIDMHQIDVELKIQQGEQ